MSDPYYEDDLVTLYHGDCLDNPEWWTGADVLITDPPYGMAYKSGWVDYQPPIRGDGDQSSRDRALALWGARPALIFGVWNQPRPSGVRQRLIWSKGADPGMGDLSMPWGKSDEEIYVLGTGWTGARVSNVITVGKPPISERCGHPTPKPVSLMEVLISRAPSGVIADPFAGSGSTLVAAKAIGRRAVGVEVEERYCELAANRLAQDALDFGCTA